MDSLLFYQTSIRLIECQSKWMTDHSLQSYKWLIEYTKVRENTLSQEEANHKVAVSYGNWQFMAVLFTNM